MDIILSLLTNINIIFYILAFLFGGIPFGFLLIKIIYKKDLRKFGSGSIGATNVYRTLKILDPDRAKVFSILTIVLDATKGMIMVALAKILGLSFETQWAVAIFSILGHCYSPYLKFKGGKGVSTAIGSVMLLIPISGLVGLVIWFFIGKFIKISSLSSLLGVLIGILSTFIIYPEIPHIKTHLPVILIGIIIIYTHIPNIKRLIKGKEIKI